MASFIHTFLLSRNRKTACNHSPPTKTFWVAFLELDIEYGGSLKTVENPWGKKKNEVVFVHDPEIQAKEDMRIRNKKETIHIVNQTRNECHRGTISMVGQRGCPINILLVLTSHVTRRQQRPSIQCID